MCVRHNPLFPICKILKGGLIKIKRAILIFPYEKVIKLICIVL